MWLISKHSMRKASSDSSSVSRSSASASARVRPARAPDSVSARASAISAFFCACSSHERRTPCGRVSTRATRVPPCSASRPTRPLSGSACEQTSTGGMAPSA
ncbi:Uncharacterised protein [Bordetella pertussis]|nr:Uncharacterised protein [Bordetella pertussis]